MHQDVHNIYNDEKQYKMSNNKRMVKSPMEYFDDAATETFYEGFLAYGNILSYNGKCRLICRLKMWATCCSWPSSLYIPLH